MFIDVHYINSMKNIEKFEKCILKNNFIIVDKIMNRTLSIKNLNI